MKTAAQIKFDKVIKEGFHECLKPAGFKKKINKQVYEQLLSNTKSTNLLFLKTVKEYGQKYGLDGPQI
jgi:hypothetical protein